MNIALTIIFALVFIYGLIGRVPKFVGRKWMPVWRIYWILVAISVIVVIWVVKLNQILYWTLVGVATSWFTVPMVATAIYFLCLGFYGLGGFVWSILCFIGELLFVLGYELFDLVFGAMIDKRRMRQCEKILASDKASEAGKRLARYLLADIMKENRITCEHNDSTAGISEVSETQ